MTKLLSVGLVIVAALPALAQDAAIADETAPAANTAKATADPAEVAKAAEKGTEPFVPPPGFRPRSSGT